jgi:hypothetical protein
MRDDLLSINGTEFYVDIDALSEFIKISPDEVKHHIRSKDNPNGIGGADINPSTMINITKYDLSKMMIDCVFNMGFPIGDNDEMDETERLVKGMPEKENLDNMPLPFKLAFNTLIINKIIKNYEPTNRKNKRVDSEAKK